VPFRPLPTLWYSPQIGFEKHNMLNLFIQVPKVIRKRLARRCKELYECAWAERAASEGADDGEGQQVLSKSFPVPPCLTFLRALLVSHVSCPPLRRWITMSYSMGHFTRLQ
jgi:hypothetical protein